MEQFDIFMATSLPIIGIFSVLSGAAVSFFVRSVVDGKGLRLKCTPCVCNPFGRILVLCYNNYNINIVDVRSIIRMSKRESE